MKNKLSSLILSGITGIGIGVPITLTCMTLIGGFNGVVAEFLTWTVASALFGILSGLTLFAGKDWNLLTVSALHCAGCLIVASAAGAICGYADSFLELLVGILPVFVVVYAVLYAIGYFSMKAEAKRINEELDKK